MRLPRTLSPSVAAAALVISAHAAEDGIDFFEKRIRPVLAEHCYDCHGEQKRKGGLRLDSREAMRQGGDSGPALAPGKPDESLLLAAVRYADKDLQMPPPKDGAPRQLPAQAIADLEAWIRMGAPDPRDGTVSATPAPPAFDVGAAREKWPFTPVRRPEAPAVRHAGWPRNDVDRFILAKLEAQGLAPSPEADSRTLIRRLTFDLTGLPPTPEEAEAFVRECASSSSASSPTAPDAGSGGEKGEAKEKEKEEADPYARLVDRLLASPRYGERWARHWLDVVRYTDSFDSRILSGDGRRMDCTEAWRYRDWVVEAFNRDLPYDAFVAHQVAGDILAAGDGFDPAKIIATGAFAIGNWGGGDADKEKLLTDIVDDQVDLTGRAFLGLTIACARCHDHKFDPISTADYYGLAGIFFSSHILPDPGPKTNGPDMLRIPLLAPAQADERRKMEARLAELDARRADALVPLSELKRNAHGKPGLHARHPHDAENPSLVVNLANDEIRFLSVRLPSRAISLHPGPKAPVTAAWRSPLRGTVRISGKLRDADPTCGDGIQWRVRKGGETLARGDLNNGAEAAIPGQEIAVEPGDLVRLVVKPRAEYTCDSTQVEFSVSAAGGRVWSLHEAVLNDTATDRDGAWIVCAGDSPRLVGEGSDTDFSALEAERKALAARLAEPIPVAHGLQEGGCPKSPHAGIHDVRVHVRGRYDRLGALVPRRFPAVLAGEAQPPIGAGSGRLALAHWLTRKDHPLTARVLVNRVWQHHFGEGLVRTPNNFGRLGEAPTHPELLDWLADEFVRSGWSLKKLHRLILSSATWRQSSRAAPDIFRADPDNKLLARFPRRRLESEALRDSLLAVAGQLDLAAGGPAARDFSVPRRTLYLLTVRSDRTGFQPLFDAADPTGIVEKRTASTVAPQALFLLNHPFVLAQAEALAARVPQGSDAVDRLHRLLYARPAKPAEFRAAEQAFRAGLSWLQYCHALLCANEFLYLD
jgi:hypothetical protein